MNMNGSEIPDDMIQWIDNDIKLMFGKLGYHIDKEQRTVTDFIMRRTLKPAKQYWRDRISLQYGCHLEKQKS